MTENKKVSRTLLTKITVFFVDFNWYGSLLGIAVWIIVTIITTAEGNGIATAFLTLKFNEQATENSAVLKENPVVVQYVSGPAVLRVNEKSKIWAQFAIIPVSFLYLIVAYLLRKTVRSAGEGKPFTFENVRRVRLIGILIMLYGPLVSLVIYLISLPYLEHLSIPGAVISAGIPNIGSMLNMVLLGLIVLVLAQVFDMGVRLQQDNDLTV